MTLLIKSKRIKTEQLQAVILKDMILAHHKTLFLTPCITGRTLSAYKKHIDTYCWLIARCLNKQQNHNFVVNSFDLGGEKGLTKLFGNNKSFGIINSICQAFESTGIFKQGKSNLAYKFNDRFLHNLNILVKADTVPVYDYKEWAVWAPIKYDDTSVCSIEGNKLTSMLYDPSISDIDRLYVWSLRESYTIHNNTIPQYYVKGGKTDRLFGVGPLSIQRLPRKIRHKVMADYYEYDLSAACYTILLNLSKDQSVYPTIQQYVKDVKGFRSLIANSTDATVDDVKAVLLHKSFGSSLSSRSGIAQEISNTIINQLRTNKLYAAFSGELVHLKKELYKLHPEKMEEFKNSRDVYPAGSKKAGQFKGTYSATYLCWLYQHHERKVIQLIRDELTDYDDCLLIHDAIYTKQQLDTVYLETLIKQKLNLDIKIG
ncbi:hypothetical protein [Aeromonas sobria]|uniref:hypothetical protein n=1 Tax=Aeromonas sobria TaxID=646 RepID=UPI000C6D95F7|nr:hypothetical protein [Aeromonas sobria]PKQ78101.1 hypothetical protein CJF47_07415 [Aeromonas sobria]